MLKQAADSKKAIKTMPTVSGRTNQRMEISITVESSSPRDFTTSAETHAM